MFIRARSNASLSAVYPASCNSSLAGRKALDFQALCLSKTFPEEVWLFRKPVMLAREGASAGEGGKGPVITRAFAAAFRAGGRLGLLAALWDWGIMGKIV